MSRLQHKRRAVAKQARERRRPGQKENRAGWPGLLERRVEMRLHRQLGAAVLVRHPVSVMAGPVSWCAHLAQPPIQEERGNRHVPQSKINAKSITFCADPRGFRNPWVTRDLEHRPNAESNACRNQPLGLNKDLHNKECIRHIFRRYVPGIRGGTPPDLTPET